MHANAVNYHPGLDQIAISSRRFNEMWVIDHNTTSEQAAGPAGDLLYRFGNPEAYGQGTEDDRLFYGQHDVQWIPEGHPQAGQFAIYNNGDDRPGCMCSTVDTWTPPMQADGTYALSGDGTFGPEGWGWSYPETPNVTFFSPNISGVQPQPNGNYLVCEGAGGRLFEVTQSGETVWEYINPEGNFGVSPQGTNPQQNSVFRAYRYGPDFLGFDGKDLTPGEPLEGPSDFSCDLFPADGDTASTNGAFPTEMSILMAYPNPANDVITLSANLAGMWTIRNVLGQTLAQFHVSPSAPFAISTSGWPEGMYFASLNMPNTRGSFLRLSIAH